MTETADARGKLLALPSAGLGHWPTPLDRLDRFGAAVGCEIWMKRDDVQGVALAGNKIRKFDLVLGQALADGIDTVVTTGAAQSNSARTGASAAAAVGLDCVLLLSGQAPDQPSANLLIDHLVGAEVRFAGDVGWSALNAGVDQIVGELATQGRRAIAAPVGCSSPLGTLGFAKAFLELDAQLEAHGIEPAAIVHTTTSGGTHAGLLVGRALSGRNVRIIGVDAGALFRDAAAGHLALARDAAALIDLDLELAASAVEITADQLGPGYGRHTAAATEAIHFLARSEAIVTDPIYSGKGLAGLVALARADVAGPLVFWHTGGYHAVFDPTHGEPLVAGPAG